MAETKQSTQAAVKAAAPSPPPLGRAGESGDPVVHQLLAERQTALINGDAAGIADADRRLAELGYGA
jgi:hypothetical protein